MEVTNPAWRIRPWYGIFPLSFLIWTIVVYIMKHEIWTVLWICDFSNLVLALGLFLWKPDWVWMSTILLLLGAPLWVWEDWALGQFRLHAFFIHIVSAIIGLAAIRQMPREGTIWWKSLALMIGVQILSRHTTPPELNINVAHSVYSELTPYFSTYTSYQIFNLLVFAVSLAFYEQICARFLEPRGKLE